eukprot:m.30130 g.30130  ORF g.30130 m.30130 type:complete len:237 (-) comp16219_c0_seq1:446-1156(-)
MARMMRYLGKKMKGTTTAVFLGTHRFTEVWGQINPAKMQSFVESKVPPEEEWTERFKEVDILKTKLGIRLEPTDGSELETNGPISFIPRMMAAVCSIPSLMDQKTKRPVIALMSYDAIELADGQVPAPTEKVEFFITLIRFNSERKATNFSSTIIQLWSQLRVARKLRLEKGLSDARVTKDLSEAQKTQRRRSISVAATSPSEEYDDGDDDDGATEGSKEASDESGYLEVHAFGLG